MDNLDVETQELGIDLVLDENEAQRKGNGYGIKKRSFTLDEKTTILGQLDAAKLVKKKGALTRIANLHNISIQTISKWTKNPDLHLQEVILTPQNAKKRKLTAGRGIKNPNVDTFVADFVQEQRERITAVSARNVAIAMMKNFPVEYDGKSSNQVRQNAYRILDRKGFRNRRVTNIETVLSEEEMGFVAIT